MKLVVGDVLIKIDTRAWVIPHDIRDHVMLVVDVNENGLPIVAHIKFTDHRSYSGKLVIEPCAHAKDLVLVHCTTFHAKLRQTIARLAKQACENDKLYINKPFLAEEIYAASPYRWSEPFSKELRLSTLRRLPVRPRDIIPVEPALITCHEFVLSLIQHACALHNLPLPCGFNLPSRFAWSDILVACATNDDALICTDIERISPASIQYGLSRGPHFFKPSLPLLQQPYNERTKLGCVLM